MTERVTISVNGKPLSVPSGTIVAAAVALAGVTRFRSSIHGESRGPLCGMGVCFECRVTIDGQPHGRSCLTLCEEGMEVRTDD
jgi:sarcosine oxidase subunit alpha